LLAAVSLVNTARLAASARTEIYRDVPMPKKKPLPHRQTGPKLSDTEPTAMERLSKAFSADGDVTTPADEDALERALILHVWDGCR
jgi:hypothetical protein